MIGNVPKQTSFRSSVSFGVYFQSCLYMQISLGDVDETEHSPQAYKSNDQIPLGNICFLFYHKPVYWIL